jgi:two-component system OmpR family response regulator|tara:strand:+ start:7178 stop:7909 length:732 start_codon:yes stop_codon:yes gene_type:complete
MEAKNQSAVLIVEDEPASLNLLASYFTAENYIVYKASSSDQAEKLFSEKVIDIILMDIKIPGRTGLELTREFRSRSGVGIILVTQKNDDIDKIVGLELGADDYVTKPYNPRELTVRVRNLLERVKYRSNPGNSNFGDVKTAQFGDWTLFTGKRVLRNKAGDQARLTEGEFQLISTLIQHAGTVLNRDQIMNHMKHRDWFPTDRTIDVMIARIRKKLGDDRTNPKYINTAHGTGYIFVADVVHC